MEEITFEDLNDLWVSPPPPPLLYKYLSAERVENVLRQRTVRFTPMLNTNDSFEVRSTFKHLFGPKMTALLRQSLEKETNEQAIKQMIAKELVDRGLGDVSVELAWKMLEAAQGGDVVRLLRTQAESYLENTILPLMNTPETAWSIVEGVGSNLLGFSLAEQAGNAMMWAHYAENHTGLVVAFDTSVPWFAGDKTVGRSPLQKVVYHDEVLDEPLDDLRAAFVSKTKVWEHEREWRVYANAKSAPVVVGSVDDPVHLFSFPGGAVRQIIVGHKASEETIAAVISAAKEGVPDADTFRAVPDRATGSMKMERL